ncbi:helix-turn-helix transcriptional regulator [Paenibacillus amylolyticus]|uniref:helix-turn-helix transcriptional regulator n=1 Tax=Paenibacillus amylolyticus TaxID=1451 RepID=UPI000FD76BB9|nr:helix-turn-helix transcriptional regulator [Paenibacillus amylolyticus]
MTKNILSEKLKQYREQKEITQQELAELLDVSDKSISKWELGNGYPSKKNMMKIADLLDVSLEVMLIEEKQEEKKFKKSLKYELISYCIIFAVTILIKGWREQERYQDLWSENLSEVVKLVFITFGQNIFTALIPSMIIGLVFYFYIIPRQEVD